MAILSEEQRSQLADADFAVPEKRKLPIHDEEHARLAWDMLDRTHGLSPGERDSARHRIMAALHRHGVRFSGYSAEPRADRLGTAGPIREAGEGRHGGVPLPGNGRPHPQVSPGAASGLAWRARTPRESGIVDGAALS